MTLVDALKSVMPQPVRLFGRMLRRKARESRDARLTCREVFTKIYQDKEWGGGEADFYSGPGSSREAAKPYTDAITAFIRTHDIRSVVDVGCGDFRVGEAIASTGVRYVGIDIVEPLIARNQSLYGSDLVAFMSGNAAEDDLPDADLCLVREVFQHLSNDEIGRALVRMRKYPCIIVTDHQPAPGITFRPNRDKPHGRDIRLFDGSALAFDQAPFEVANISLFLDVRSPNSLFDPNERLRSFLIRNRAARREGPVREPAVTRREPHPATPKRDGA